MNSARKNNSKSYSTRERMLSSNNATGFQAKDSRFCEILLIEISKFDKVEDVRR